MYEDYAKLKTVFDSLEGHVSIQDVAAALAGIGGVLKDIEPKLALAAADKGKWANAAAKLEHGVRLSSFGE